MSAPSKPVRVPPADPRTHWTPGKWPEIDVREAFRRFLADPGCRAWLDEPVLIAVSAYSETDGDGMVRTSDAIEARLREDPPAPCDCPAGIHGGLAHDAGCSSLGEVPS